jgi:hypothetical protein
MTYIHTGALSSYAGLQGVNWWYGRLIKKGIIPLFSQEDAQKAPELRADHPFNNKVLKSLYIASVFIYLFFMGVLPFVFYFLQKTLLQTPDMVFFDNTLPAVLSLFPSLVFGFWLSYLTYLKIGEIWPDYSTMAAYSSIIAANKFANGGPYDKTPWQKLIKQTHIHALKEYEERFFRKVTIWVLVLTLPIYGLLFFTYQAATNKSIIETTLGTTVSHQLSDMSKIDASLTFKEEKNDGKYELRPYIKINALFKDGKNFNLCDFGCNKNTGLLLEYISIIKNNYHVPIEVTPLKAYQKELLQKENPSMFLFYQQLVQTSR